MTTTRGLRADAARNYERIVTAAAHAFEDTGPEVTLEEVARRAGVGIATVYRRFGNREELVRAVLEQLLEQEIAPVVQVRTDDPWQDLTGALRAAVDVLAGRRVLLRLAKETGAFRSESLKPYGESLHRLLSRAIEAGLVRPELEVRDLAAVIVMALAPLRPHDTDTADRRRYLALLVDGLRPGGAPLPAGAEHPVLLDEG